MMKTIKYIALALLLLSGCKNKTSENKNTALQEASNSKDSLAIVSKEIDVNPNKAGLYYLRSHLFKQENRLELAIRDVEHAVSLDSTQSGWFVYLADLYMERPYVKGALLSLEKAAQLNPKDKNLYVRLGKLFFEVKNRERSFLYLNKALKLDPNMAEAFYWRGYNYREMKDSKKAIENFERCIELNPKYFDAYVQLGFLYGEQKNSRAESYYQSALALKPNDVKVLYARGMYYQSIDSFQKAANDYQQILVQDQGSRSANYNLGYIYYLQKDYRKSKQYFTKAIEADPNYIEAYIGRGNAFRMTGDIELFQHDLDVAAQLEKKKEEDSK